MVYCFLSLYHTVTNSVLCLIFGSFLATNNKQTEVTLAKKFDNWEYSWWKSLEKRMPWFDKTGDAHKALLTTSSSSTYYPAGSIIYGDMEYDPALYMRKGEGWPGTIWYWINEDDCDANRQPGELHVYDCTEINIFFYLLLLLLQILFFSLYVYKLISNLLQYITR